MESITFAGFRATCLSPSGEHRFSQQCRFIHPDDEHNSKSEEERLCLKPVFYWAEKEQFLPTCKDHLIEYVDVAKLWDRDFFRRQKKE